MIGEGTRHKHLRLEQWSPVIESDINGKLAAQTETQAPLGLHQRGAVQRRNSKAAELWLEIGISIVRNESEQLSDDVSFVEVPAISSLPRILPGRRFEYLLNQHYFPNLQLHSPPQRKGRFARIPSGG